MIAELLDGLRAASRHGEVAVAAALQASRTRLADDAGYREALQAEVRALLLRTHSTHLLTEVGILSDEPLVGGTLGRVAVRLAPPPVNPEALDNALREVLRPQDAAVATSVRHADAVAWIRVFVGETRDWDDPADLASAMVILATRVAGAGMDPQLCERMPSLELWNSPFLALSRVIDHFAEAYSGEASSEAEAYAAIEAIDRCIDRVTAFRAEKQELGTTLRLSSASLRMLQQLHRLRLLVRCTLDATREDALAQLGVELVEGLARPRKALHFLREKLDLIAYLVIGHAAQKGNKYAARTTEDYAGFWAKSLGGGVIVAVFALLKLHLNREGLAPGPQALVYGANYAICFVLIFLFGATLATKQPALTASRIADALDEGPEHESFPHLVRAIWRSQFVSFLGNIAGAAVFALLLAGAFQALTGNPLIGAEDAKYLALKMHPTRSGAIWFAAVAGVMLSTAGFLAGWIDNAVVFHRLADRVEAGGGVFRWVPRPLRAWFAGRLHKNAGAIFGNATLGFMLGSAGTIGMIVGLPFDIRHIAFASSHGAVALMAAPELLTPAGVLLVLASVCIIGFVNFIVSFTLTLTVAVHARKLDGVDWRESRRQVWALFRENPVAFWLPRETNGEGGEGADGAEPAAVVEPAES